MTTITKNTKLLPFLFMGCWNHGDEPRGTVAEAIITNPIKTLVLGGDNVYPEKVRIGNATDFTKVYSMKTLMNGINLLHGKDIYAALGNHNIGGPMLNVQLGLSQWTMPSRYYCIQFRDYALIIIDSNLVETVGEYEIMRNWLSDKIRGLKESGMPYFYVQHEPFIAFKKKKKVVLPNSYELLSILSQYPPIVVLCADVHNYQRGRLQIGDVTITQIICGTGGADPDFVKASVGDKFVADDITYTMDDYIPGYGYLEVKGVDNIEFIKVSDWRAFEGVGGNFLGKSSQKHQKTILRKSLQKQQKTILRKSLQKQQKTILGKDSQKQRYKKTQKAKRTK
jgi:hypothetical protein